MSFQEHTMKFTDAVLAPFIELMKENHVKWELGTLYSTHRILLEKLKPKVLCGEDGHVSEVPDIEKEYLAIPLGVTLYAIRKGLHIPEMPYPPVYEHPLKSRIATKEFFECKDGCSVACITLQDGRKAAACSDSKPVLDWHPSLALTRMEALYNALKFFPEKETQNDIAITTNQRPQSI